MLYLLNNFLLSFGYIQRQVTLNVSIACENVYSIASGAHAYTWTRYIKYNKLKIHIRRVQSMDEFFFFREKVDLYLTEKESDIANSFLEYRGSVSLRKKKDKPI